MTIAGDQGSPESWESFQTTFPGCIVYSTMADLTHPKLIYAKGFLFLLAGLMSAGLLVLDHPTARTVLLVVLACWCFARFYYFAFYVIQHYVDPSYRFSGLWSFAQYLLGRRRSQPR